MIVTPAYMSKLPTNSKVHLYVTTMDKQLKNVVVVKQAFVGILDKLFPDIPDEKISYVYKGNLLLKSFRFIDYDISSEDYIIATFNNQDLLHLKDSLTISSTFIEETKHKTGSYVAKLVANNELRHEMERINDIRFKMNELKRTRASSRIIQQRIELQTNDIPLEMPQTASISKDSLPKFW